MPFLGDVNAFRSCVDAGTVQFGSLEPPFPEGRQQITGDARVFIRPHDVTIDTKTNGPPTTEAKVVRVHSAGPLVRGDLLASANRRLTSEISQERFATMKQQVESRVYVRPRHIRVFAGNGQR